MCLASESVSEFPKNLRDWQGNLKCIQKVSPSLFLECFISNGVIWKCIQIVSLSLSLAVA